MKHVMIDLETLSHRSDAAIIQIGAVSFDLHGLGRSFKATIPFESAMKYGNVSPETLRWWMCQDKEARNSVTNGQVELEQALHALTYFFKEVGNETDKLQFWAHATFDFPILQRAYEVTGIVSPLGYKRMRDLRTLEIFCGDAIQWMSRDESKKHDALQDALYQAEHAMLMLRHMDKMINHQPKETL